MIKLISIDLDGTLYNSDSKISLNNKIAINKCLRKGIKVVISTGKSINVLKEVIQELNLKDYQIAAGGTAIISGDLNSIIAKKIPRKTIIDLVGFTLKQNVEFTLNTTDGNHYYLNDCPEIEHLSRTGEYAVKVKDILADYIINNTILLTFLVDKNHPFNLVLQKNIEKNLKIRRGGDIFLNVLDKNAGKFSALKEIMKNYDIRPGEVMAIGDNENDLSSIRHAGIGVAMGNSIEIVKKTASYITDDNDRDGVAKAINKFIILAFN